VTPLNIACVVSEFQIDKLNSQEKVEKIFLPKKKIDNAQKNIHAMVTQ